MLVNPTPMAEIAKHYQINAPINLVWDALVNPELIAQWSGDPNLYMSDRLEDFKLWSGDIWGKNIEVSAPTLLKQEWNDSRGVSGSIVTFTLSGDGDTTHLDLVHTDVSDDRATDLSNGWDDFFMAPMIEFVESMPL